SKPITLRQLMAHRSGLVREPPAGNYFDSSNPSLAQMVRSLNQTELVYEPGTKTKYSNAAIGVVGFVLEKTQKEAFVTYLQRKLVNPMGMTRSGFGPTVELKKNLAVATMWTYHGRVFEAPTFELGMAPAGCMYSTATDLARFLKVLFGGGRGPQGLILKPATLELMFKPQFVKREEEDPEYGIGFRLKSFHGHRRIGHGGAIYGFATELAALPAEKLGVVVIASRDCVNAVTTRIADAALQEMLIARGELKETVIEETQPIQPETARKWAGHYRHEKTDIALIERAGKLWMLPHPDGLKVEVRALPGAFVVDDRLSFGTKLALQGDEFRIGQILFKRVAPIKPALIPAKWLGLIGEYGWDHNILYILERHGKLHVLIEWFFLYPLEEVSENVFQFPNFGLYQGEKLLFKRDQTGRASAAEAAQVVFPRREIDGENGATFRIRSMRPLDLLHREALAAKPPPERGEFANPDLVEVTSVDPTVKLDIRYATTNNFLSTPFYSSAKAFLQRPAVEALVRVHKKLASQGFGLLIHDGYRPWYVSKMFWEATPPKHRVFVADPEQGSRHNRGCAVDLTLYDLKTGKPVEMVGGYDEFSDRSFPDYLGGTSLQRWHRDLLRRSMEEEGFTVFEAEWWHFDYKDWKKYAILNWTFEQLNKK
ncbi:MAG TPA: serine hydrolase, partial [Gemmataceae bacterium]|nr:serine hydrolase [Gemmataceae bacterium]